MIEPEQVLISLDGLYTTGQKEPIMSDQSIGFVQCSQGAIEEWRPVVDMENAYEVSTHGRIRSLKSGRVLCATNNGLGYFAIRLQSGSKVIRKVIHRLVIEAFSGHPPSESHECNHKDGDKSNNHINNLEWVTPAENNQHARATGLWKPNCGEQHGCAKLTKEKVLLIRGYNGKATPQSIAKMFNVSDSLIRKIWQRKNWRHI